MNELFHQAFTPVNAFLSIMCIAFLLYWLLVIIGGLDPDYFSVDFDADADIDLDVDTDSVDPNNTQTNADSGDGFFVSILKFFHFDELPLMFMLTIIFFVMWFLSINITHYLGVSGTLVGVVLYIPYAIISLFVVKIFARPLIYLYRIVNHKGETEIDFLGRRCMVVSQVTENKIGQIELLVNGDPIKLYAKSNTEQALLAGQQAVIVHESIDKKYYLIEKFDY